eukprot:209561-Rhodomonas_salina.1
MSERARPIRHRESALGIQTRNQERARAETGRGCGRRRGRPVFRFLCEMSLASWGAPYAASVLHSRAPYDFLVLDSRAAYAMMVLDSRAANATSALDSRAAYARSVLDSRAAYARSVLDRTTRGAGLGYAPRYAATHGTRGIHIKMDTWQDMRAARNQMQHRVFLVQGVLRSR